MNANLTTWKGSGAGSGRIMASLLAVFFLLSLTIPALAQVETGQIIGKVIDPNGAVIAGASVTVKSVATGVERSATTDGEGVFTVANLQPGLYEITMQVPGFAPATRRAQVTVGAKLSLEMALSIQPQQEAITITGSEGVAVNTQTQELSNIVSSTQVRELPTLTRNPYDFVVLSGNISPADPSGRGVGFAMNGQRASSTNILLDGGENVDYFTATVGQTVPLDSVQEFRVVTNNFSAEYGRASGGIVNVATRAGSNEFHGTAYEYNRVSALASNSFSNNANQVPKGVFTRNQFGYSAGGRIIKEKLFFFNSTEWTRVRSTGNVINLAPTSQLIAAAAPATQSFFNAFPLATPINGRIFSVGEVTSLLNLPAGTPFTSLPASLPAFGQVQYALPQDLGGGAPQNTYQTISRVDWNLSEKTQVYGRYALESVGQFAGTVSSSPYQGFNTPFTGFNNNFLVSVTRTFSPNFVSQTKLTFNRLNQQQPLGQQAAGPTLYFFGSTTARIGSYPIALPGYLPFSPGSGIPFGGPQNFAQLYEDINYTTGKHQFRFGGQYVYNQDNRTFGAYQTASETLASPGNYSQALTNFLGGQLRQFQAAIDPQGKFPGQTLTLPVGQPNFSRSNRYKEFALYVNDSWRFRPRLTFNLGLRYEYYGVQKNSNPKLDSNFYFGSGANIFERIRNGGVQLAPQSPVGGLWKPDKNNFAPRVGFAWDVFGDGKTSVRGGYGIAYERNFGNVTFNVIQNPPNYAVISLVAGVDVPSIPITTSNAGLLAGTSGTKVLPATSLRYVREDIRNAYAQFWSFSVEREVLPRTVASVEYSGSRGIRLYTLENINIPGSGAIYLGDAPGLTRLNRQYTNINTRGNNGRSTYNGLTLSLVNNSLSSRGLQFTARYTHSHARDNLSSTFSESANNFNLGLLDPFNWKLDYGYADFDVRQRFVGSWSWKIPYAYKTSGVVGQLLKGWEMTGIFTARTGAPFTVFDCTNGLSSCARLTPTGALSFERAGKLAADPAVPNRFVFIDLSRQTPGNYINPLTETSDFGPFPANMTRRNAFRGPGVWNLDGGVYKSVKLTERYSMQLRGEFYNLFNHANLYIRGSEAEVGTGFVPAYRDGRRNVQLALKFIF